MAGCSYLGPWRRGCQKTNATQVARTVRRVWDCSITKEMKVYLALSGSFKRRQLFLSIKKKKEKKNRRVLCDVTNIKEK